MNLDHMLVSENDLPARRIIDWHEAVREFNSAAEVEMASTPTLQDARTRELRLDLLEEETWELYRATGGTDQQNLGDMPEIADALADIIYIAIGTAQVYGIDLRPVFAEVHAANMRKRGTDGKMVRRADGKILKPEGWVGPDIAGVLRKQGWRG